MMGGGEPSAVAHPRMPFSEEGLAEMIQTLSRPNLLRIKQIEDG